MTTNKNELIAGRAVPGVVFKLKAFAGQLKEMPSWALLKPKDAFGPKYIFRKLIVEESLEFLECEGAIALKRERHKSVIL